MTQETIIFTNVTGSYQIDMTQNSRIDRFGNNFTVTPYYVLENGNQSTVEGYGVEKTPYGSLIKTVNITGLIGIGFITLTKFNEKNCTCVYTNSSSPSM